MVQNVEAVYENGLLRPLHPLNLKEAARVRLSITEEGPQRDRTDYLLLEYARARTAALTHVPTLDEVQERLSKIPGSLAAAIAADREED